MDSTRLAPAMGIVAALLVLALLALPFLLVPEVSAVRTYYDGGAFTPLATGLFALLSVVVFAAGREDRADPAIAAGATLVMGIFAVGTATVWALTVPRSLVTQLSTAAILEFHPLALALVSLALPVCAVWYARSLRLL